MRRCIREGGENVKPVRYIYSRRYKRQAAGRRRRGGEQLAKPSKEQAAVQAGAGRRCREVCGGRGKRGVEPRRE